MVLQGILVPKVHKVAQDLQVLVDHKGHKGPKERQGLKGHNQVLDHKGHKDPKVHKGRKVLQELKVRLGLVELKEPKVRKVQQVWVVLQDLRGLLVAHKERKELEDQPVLSALRVFKELKVEVHKDQQVLKEIRDLVLKELKEPQTQEQLDFLVLKVMPEEPGLRELKVLLGLKDFQVHQRHLVSKLLLEQVNLVKMLVLTLISVLTLIQLTHNVVPYFMKILGVVDVGLIVIITLYLTVILVIVVIGNVRVVPHLPVPVFLTLD